MPFAPGTNAIARVVAVGANVTHVRSGDRVFLSPHLRGDVPDLEPPQILIGLTATVTTPAAFALQARWRDGVFAEIAHWPAACVTPLKGLDDKPATEQRPRQTDRAVRRPAAQRPARRRHHHHQRRDRLFRFRRGDAGSGDGCRPGRRCRTKCHSTGIAARGIRSPRGGRRGQRRSRQGPQHHPNAAGGSADVALDLLGSAKSTSTTLSSLRALKRGGRLVVMGSAEVPLEISFRNCWRTTGRSSASSCTSDMLRPACRAGGRGLLDLGKIRVKTFPLDQFKQAVEAAASMQGLDLTAVVP